MERKDKLPLKSGVHYQGDAPQAERMELRRLQVSQATRLADLVQDFVLFSPALLYLRVPLYQRNPFYDFATENNQDPGMQMLGLPQPIFSGLGPAGGQGVSWNNGLWVTEKSIWQKLRNWLGRLAFVDPNQSMIYRIRWQRLVIPDWLALRDKAVLPDRVPTVLIAAIAIETDRGSHFFRPSTDWKVPHPLVSDPQVRYLDTVDLVDALLQEHEDPYQVADDGKISRGELDLQQESELAAQQHTQEDNDDESDSAADPVYGQ